MPSEMERKILRYKLCRLVANQSPPEDQQDAYALTHRAWQDVEEELAALSPDEARAIRKQLQPHVATL